MLKAVTFDLWDTLVHDDSDEAVRRARGLRSKRDERRHLLWEALSTSEPIEPERVALAYDVADAAFNRVWKGHSVTWTIAERLDVISQGLGRTLDADTLASVIEATARMEVDIPPAPIPGVAEALAQLADRYALCIVSDAIVTPGIELRRLLRVHGLESYFSGFAFSDEVGHSKPHASMFESAARQLGVAIDEMVHVGDRDHNDVKGPQALGMQAVLFTATRDADRAHTSADAICDRHADLPEVIDRLAGKEAV